MTKQTIEKIKGLANKGKIYTDGESVMGVETVCTTDDLKELVGRLKHADEILVLLGKYYPITEDAISFELGEYYLKYPDVVPPELKG